MHPIIITVSKTDNGMKSIIVTQDGHSIATAPPNGNSVRFSINTHTWDGYEPKPRWRNALDDPTPPKIRVDTLRNTGGNFTFVADEHIDWASNIGNSGDTFKVPTDRWNHLPNGDTEEWTFQVVDTFK